MMSKYTYNILQLLFMKIDFIIILMRFMKIFRFHLNTFNSMSYYININRRMIFIIILDWMIKTTRMLILL